MNSTYGIQLKEWLQLKLFAIIYYYGKEKCREDERDFDSLSTHIEVYVLMPLFWIPLLFWRMTNGYFRAEFVVVPFMLLVIGYVSSLVNYKDFVAYDVEKLKNEELKGFFIAGLIGVLLGLGIAGST